jgi:hypothetical protein
MLPLVVLFSVMSIVPWGAILKEPRKLYGIIVQLLGLLGLILTYYSH